MDKLGRQIDTLQEFAASAPVAIPNVLEQLRFYEGDIEAFQKKCKGNYDKLIKNILLQLKIHRDNLKWIKDRIR